jgi:hypothetical protein
LVVSISALSLWSFSLHPPDCTDAPIPNPSVVEAESIDSHSLPVDSPEKDMEDELSVSALGDTVSIPVVLHWADEQGGKSVREPAAAAAVASS